jgi:hypothetical protein
MAGIQAPVALQPKATRSGIGSNPHDWSLMNLVAHGGQGTAKGFEDNVPTF